MTTSFADFLGLTLHARQAKPRARGLCMVIDTGYSLPFVRGVLELYGHLVDIAKLTELHLTANVGRIREKVALYREFGVHVQPGGVVVELARLQGREAEVLARLRELGFDTLEVSSSTTTQRPGEEERRFVGQAREFGFDAMGEVGKKFHEGDRTRRSDTELDVPETVAEMQTLLAAGSTKVYWEGHVLRRVMGDTAAEILRRHPEATSQVLAVADAVGAENIVFEVSSMIPYVQRRAQQFWLVRNFGPEVNLGNVRLEEVQYLEHVRLGTWPVFGFGALGDHPYMQALEKAGPDGTPSATWWRDLPLV
jgi:phosphosulfolactate synthase